MTVNHFDRTLFALLSFCAESHSRIYTNSFYISMKDVPKYTVHFGTVGGKSAFVHDMHQAKRVGN